MRPVQVTATIVDLAARGYLRIEAVGPGGSDWRLVRLTDPDDGWPYHSDAICAGASARWAVLVRPVLSGFWPRYV